jgi:NAD(P)-dependent dehydrogenase (short-subunit alcohol dehydrogenase family)
MDLRLKDKVAIVTGGGSGIGRETCRTFAREGAHVAIVDLNLVAAQATAQEVTALGVQAMAIGADVSQPDDVQRMTDSVLEQLGRIDVLVNAAGIFQATPIEELSVEDWDKLMRVNLRSVFLCSQAAMKVMKRQRSGKIVSIASLAAQVGGVFAGANYSAAKAGIVTFTKSLAKQVAGFNVNVNCVNPGPCDTPMAREWPPDAVEKTLSQCPLGRLAQPQEIANVIVFLASDAASYIHGAHVDVNGGVYMD